MASVLSLGVVDDSAFVSGVTYTASRTWMEDYVASVSGVAKRIEIKVASWNLVTASKLILCDAAGNHLEIGQIAPADGLDWVGADLIGGHEIVEGQGYRLALKSDTGHLGVYQDGAAYAAHYTTGGTFADPINPITSEAADGKGNLAFRLYVDTTASLTPTVTSSTSVTATLPVTGADGTVFAVAVGPAGSATVPTGPQIEAGTDGGDAAAIGGSTPVTAAGDIDVALTGLTANTAYTIYAVHKALDGTYGEVVSTTGTPNPVLSGTLETGADTPYADGGSWLITVLNAARDAVITTATVTPGADGSFRIVDGLLPVSTEVVVAALDPDGVDGVIGKLNVSD